MTTTIIKKTSFWSGSMVLGVVAGFACGVAAAKFVPDALPWMQHPAPAPPPPSGEIPNAPGPDNTITEMQPTAPGPDNTVTKMPAKPESPPPLPNGGTVGGGKNP